MLAYIIFFSLDFLYAEIDRADSKTDKVIVAKIKKISIFSISFILIAFGLIGRIQLFWNSTCSKVKDSNSS